MFNTKNRENRISLIFNLIKFKMKAVKMRAKTSLKLIKAKTKAKNRKKKMKKIKEFIISFKTILRKSQIMNNKKIMKMKIQKITFCQNKMTNNK